MYKKVLVVIAFSVLAANPALADKNSPDELVVSVNDPYIDVVVENSPTRMLMMANGTSTLILNPASATRVGLVPSKAKTNGRIGPVRIRGNNNKASYKIAGITQKKMVHWFDRDIADDGDGAIGPLSVPQSIVTFNFRPPEPNEREYILPLTISKAGFDALGTTIQVGGESLFILFDLQRPQTLSTAAAGALLAASNVGSFIGELGSTDVRMGISRPVRELELQKPLTVGPLSFTKFAVRTQDNGSVESISDGTSDASEIVVIGKSEKNKVITEMQIGKEEFSNCSSISFDKVTEKIRMMCQ